MNQGFSKGGTMQRERITPLNAGADSTRDIAPGPDDPYATCPAVTVPYGWRLVRRRSSWALVHDHKPWLVLMWLVSERRAGRSYQDLATELERRRVPPPPNGDSGKPRRWQKDRVRTLVQQYAPDLAPASRRTPT